MSTKIAHCRHHFLTTTKAWRELTSTATFAGVPFEVGLDATERIRSLLPDGMAMPAFALAWILQFEAVSVVIPGAKRPNQVLSNVAATGVELDDAIMAGVRAVYDELIAPHVHHRW